MTQKQALAEAQLRWGPSGSTRLRTGPQGEGRLARGKLARYRCIVGNGYLKRACSFLGQGHTWREAFEDVRARESTGQPPVS